MSRRILVVGAGPGGLACAIEAALAGHDVTVTDPKEGPIDKACGEGLMPGAVPMLERLGVRIPVSRPFTGISYHWGERMAVGRFRAGAGLGVRRTVLSDALWQRARDLGVQRRHDRVTDLTQDPSGVRAGELQADFALVADGLRSPLRVALGIGLQPRHARQRLGLRRHFRIAPWSDRVEVHWAADAEAYITPVAPDLVGVAFLYGDRARDADRDDPGTPWDRLLGRFPVLVERLAGAEPASVLRGAGPFHRVPSRLGAGRCLLVGDAAGYVDAITGEGIKLGLHGARAAVAALEAPDPVAAYEQAYRPVFRPFDLSTRALLALTGPAWVRPRMVSVLQRAPWLFDRIVTSLGA